MNRDILSTRYIDDSCLYTLGIYNNVYYLVEIIDLQNLFEHRDHTYLNMTLEFLSSLIYYTMPNSESMVCTIKFRMLNIEYTYTTDQIA